MRKYFFIYFILSFISFIFALFLSILVQYYLFLRVFIRFRPIPV